MEGSERSKKVSDKVSERRRGRREWNGEGPLARGGL